MINLYQIINCKKAALAEVNDAFCVINEIPQLHMAKLWVPYEKCANNEKCMVLASSTVDLCSDMPTQQVRQIHVQAGKGIVGMVLASESKSCFCRDLYELSIADQPLAHYERRERRDICFAICLQSSHTGDLLYVLEFFLYQDPATYECLRSFLNFLPPIMKFELKSFRIASGKPIGDELVVEVIGFSEANRNTPSASNLPAAGHVFPIKFRRVKYGQKQHQYTEDQSASDFEKMPRGKRKSGLDLSLDVLKPQFGKKLKDVAEELGGESYKTHL